MAYSLENTQDLTDLADAIRSKTGDSEEMTVAEMADAVEGIQIPTSQDLTFADNFGKSIVFSMPWVLSYINKMKVNRINANFQGYTWVHCPDIEMVVMNGSQPLFNPSALFYENSYLEDVKISKDPNVSVLRCNYNFDAMFGYCQRLKEFSFDFLEGCQQGERTSWNTHMFQACYCLRRVNGLQYLPKFSYQAQGHYYYGCFYACVALDEIKNMVVVDFSDTGRDGFYQFTHNCVRLKGLTFETNNGTPLTANWSGQILDLTSVGVWLSPSMNPADYLDGVDHEVVDAASYQLYKNDPDWYTRLPAYSRYDHDSAVATINSLPDVSAGSGCTIKFDGAKGSATDAGAVSTLTPAEIAVATAKGWTVSIT